MSGGRAAQTIADVDTCWYCGEMATTRDHIRPTSSVATGLRSLTVPACRDCNCRILGDRPLYTDTERGLFVLAQLQDKRCKTKQPPPWPADELAEMGRGIKARIRRNQRVWDVLTRRVEWATNRWIQAIDPET